MEMKKAPGTAFVTHHIWVCIFIYKCFKKSLFFRTWSAVNVDVSCCYGFTPLLYCVTVAADNDVL